MDSLRPLLEREGHSVLTATSGAGALDLLHDHDVDVILVDYHMPGMDGAELVREIRSFDPFVQIIVQTGYSGDAPPQLVLHELDIQGYHDKADGPEKLLTWVAVGLKAQHVVRRLRQRERLHTELVANVSHEIRTPLGIISGYAEMLLADEYGTVPEDAAAPLQSILSASRNLTEMVSDFLQWAKLEAGLSELTSARIDLEAIAGELRRLGTLLTDPERVRFAVEASPPPTDLVGDPIKLRTILRNLVTNAAKFTADGFITVTLRADPETLEVRVQDSGPGIPAEDQGTIFEPFRQIRGTHIRRTGGVGLGLALSLKYARLLGGALEVESEPGVGSTFVLRVPSAGPPAETTADEPASPPR